jgi:formylglycine-generating enzyme required for sulfatase activity
VSDAPETRTPRWRVWPAAVGVGVLVLAGVGVWWALRATPDPPVALPASAEPPRTRPNIPPGAMAAVPGGKVRMGSDSGDADEKPITERDVASFEIDVLEVTVADFEACVQAGKCAEPVRAEGKCNWGKAERRDHPVNCVDQAQAQAFCASLGKRLPTETEWEMAARGSAGRTYPWGNDAPAGQLCWNGAGNDVGRGKRDSTCVAGTHRGGITPEGVHDMAGNVWEWTSSRYCPYETETCSDERVVFRGGGFNNSAPGYVRGADRTKDKPTVRNDNLGFRCARGGPPAPG